MAATTATFPASAATVHVADYAVQGSCRRNPRTDKSGGSSRHALPNAAAVVQPNGVALVSANDLAERGSDGLAN